MTPSSQSSDVFYIQLTANNSSLPQRQCEGVVALPPSQRYHIYYSQVESHPSPSKLLPSSQGKVYTRPSPHISSQLRSSEYPWGHQQQQTSLMRKNMRLALQARQGIVFEPVVLTALLAVMHPKGTFQHLPLIAYLLLLLHSHALLLSKYSGDSQAVHFQAELLFDYSIAIQPEIVVHPPLTIVPDAQQRQRVALQHTMHPGMSDKQLGS